MCGILGLVGNVEDGLPVVKGGLHRLQHRGPDHQAAVQAGNAVLGAVRLSIRDERDAANQPFTSRTGRWIVTFNGELNNHRDLRKLLGDRLEWQTDSDTETIATALDQEGFEVLTRLRGMFAVVAWDTKTETLYLTRDDPGIKPLYYASATDGSFLYASEFQTLCDMLRDLGQPLAVSYRKAVEYMMYRDTLLEPETLVSSIKKVSPGELLAVDAQGKPKRLHLAELQPDPDASLDGLEELFTASIQNNIEPDRTMGMFLSGGVDSSTVMAELIRQGANVEAFTLRYETTGAFSYSEIPFSRFVCEALNVPLHELMLTEELFLEKLPQALAKQDGLSMDPTIVAYHELGAAAAENGLKVVVTGTGSDEIFGSYEWLHAESAEMFDQWMRPPTMPVFVKTDPQLWSAVQEESFARREAVLAEYQKRGFSLAESIRLFGMYHLEADALPRVDLGTMAASVECRVPLLDQDFLRTALTAPPDTHKTAFRQLAQGRIPEEIQQRPKCGFPHPVFVWLKHGKLGEQVRETLKNGALAHLIDQEAVEKFFADEASLLGKTPPAYLYDAASSLWYLFAFAMWCELHGLEIEKEPTEKAVVSS